MSDWMHCWCLVLKEYAPEIIYIPGITNIVADTLSLLEYDGDINKCIINVHV